MFFTFDKDRSGTLERAEVASAIRSLGMFLYINIYHLYAMP